jgi:hypothetical protein
MTARRFEMTRQFLRQVNRKIALQLVSGAT